MIVGKSSHLRAGSQPLAVRRANVKLPRAGHTLDVRSPTRKLTLKIHLDWSYFICYYTHQVRVGNSLDGSVFLLSSLLSASRRETQSHDWRGTKAKSCTIPVQCNYL